uniref:Uncharacterized protein n=1 Tax=Arundo donax TaxID=35708 RepID=A0A0A9GU98_ARUDO
MLTGLFCQFLECRVELNQNIPHGYLTFLPFLFPLVLRLWKLDCSYFYSPMF